MTSIGILRKTDYLRIVCISSNFIYTHKSEKDNVSDLKVKTRSGVDDPVPTGSHNIQLRVRTRASKKSTVSVPIGSVGLSIK